MSADDRWRVDSGNPKLVRCDDIAYCLIPDDDKAAAFVEMMNRALDRQKAKEEPRVWLFTECAQRPDAGYILQGPGFEGCRNGTARPLVLDDALVKRLADAYWAAISVPGGNAPSQDGIRAVLKALINGGGQ